MNLLITTQTVDMDHPALGFFHGWIVEFAKHCDEVLVICLKEGRHELPPNVKILSLGKDVRRSRFSYVWRFYHYMYAYRKQYDVVFAHMNPEYVVLGGIFWKQWKKPITLWYVHKSVTWWLRIAARFATAICTVTPESIRLQSSKIRPLGHGIDLDLFKSHGKTFSAAVRVLSIGRIAESKGLFEVLAALDLLFKQNIPFRWTIIGSPETKEERAYDLRFKQEVQKKPYASSIEYRGPVSHSELPFVFEKSDVLVNISRTGGYDKVVLEALVSGVPALSSSTPFKPLLEPHGLFIAEPTPQNLAYAIIQSAHMNITPLREQVERQHSLSALIPRILETLKS